MEEILSKEFLTRVARETKFCCRRSKFTPFMFFDVLLSVVNVDKSKSLRQLSSKAGEDYNVNISKEGINKRFNGKAVDFVKAVFEAYLSQQIDQKGLEAGWLKHFNYVRIKDGTRFDIPEDFSDYFAGSGGSASKAGVCIQYEYDIKSGRILDLTITEAKRQDVTDARETMDKVRKNDLIIRDLGYFILDGIENIMKREAFFISRINTKTTILEKKGEMYQALNFKELYTFMVQNQLTRIEKEVFIGVKKNLQVRLVIDLMPEEVYRKRIRAISKKNKKKKHKTSDEFRDRARFNLFITNLEKTKMSKDAIPTIYKIRWQIELIFKIWKSNFSIDKTREMKYERWMCVLYAKLLAIVINWDIIIFHKIKFYYESGKLLSPFKANEKLIESFDKIRSIIREKNEYVFKNHWLESKKNGIIFEEIIFHNYDICN